MSKVRTVPNAIAQAAREYARVELGMQNINVVPATHSQKLKASKASHLVPSTITDAVVVYDPKKPEKQAQLLEVRLDSVALKAEDLGMTLATFALGPLSVLTLPVSVLRVVQKARAAIAQAERRGHIEPHLAAELQVAIKHSLTGALGLGFLSGVEAASHLESLEHLHHVLEGGHQSLEAVEAADSAQNLEHGVRHRGLRGLFEATRKALVASFKVHAPHHQLSKDDVRIVGRGPVALSEAQANPRLHGSKKRPERRSERQAFEVRLDGLRQIGPHHEVDGSELKFSLKKLSVEQALELVGVLDDLATHPALGAASKRLLENLTTFHAPASEQLRSSDVREAARASLQRNRGRAAGGTAV